MVTLSLGTGVAGLRRIGRGRRPPTPIRAPALTGSGIVGAAVTVDPGDWSGAVALALQWRLDGADLPGATGSSFVSGARHDRGALSCRVVAKNAAGASAAETLPLRISQAAPALLAPLPNLRFIQASGTQILSILPSFSGAALTFAVSGEGVAINPATGELRISTDALREGVTVTVTATNSGGAATGSFRLTVAAEPLPAPLAAPALVAPPALVGTGIIGAEVTLDPGSWSGAPAFEIAWCRNGAPIEGATGTAYIPVAADDRGALTARVTASNAGGSLVAETAALAIVQAAPVATGGLADRSFAQGGVAAVIEAAPAFAGADLRFAATGAGASVDPVSGVLTIPIDAAVAEALVTVTAANSGGSAEIRFRVTVAPAQPAFPPAIADGLWSAAEVRDAAPAGRRRIAIDAGVVVPAGFELRLYSGPVAGGQAELYNRVMAPAETYLTSGSMAAGETCHNLLFWRRAADGAWAPACAAAISFEIRGLEPAPPLPVAPALIAAPALAGTGRIGDAVTLDPGAWSGAPAPALAVAWLRDGEPIVGATGAAYTPTPADDRTALAARVTAVNPTGSSAAETAPLGITHAAPEAAGALPDEVFDEDSGPQTIPTAFDFAGEGLSFSVAGAGATVDPRTGVVTIPTDAPVAGERVAVTASNSGGSAESAFLVTVEALEPAAPRTALWRAAAIPPAGSSFDVARDVGPHEPGRLVWVMVIASDAASVAIDGKPGQLVDSGSAGGAVGQVYVSDTTASVVRVAHQGTRLNVPCVLWFTTVGYAARPAEVRQAGASGSDGSPSSVELAVPADGAVLAGTRNYNLLTAPAGLQAFATGGARTGIAAGARLFGEAAALTVAAGRDAGAIGGKQLLALALAPADRGGPVEPEPQPEPEPRPQEPPVPQEPGAPSPVTTAGSVSADGVTWSFAAPRPVGYFADGNPFVVGPVSVTGYSPAPAVIEGGRAVNGAMKNIVPNELSGFDGASWHQTYRAELNAGLGLPVALEPGDALCVAIHNPGPESNAGRDVLKRVRILTCLDAVPAAESFRPAFYAGAPRILKSWSDVRTDRLAALAPLPGAPSWAATETSLQVARPYFDPVHYWRRNHMCPTDHIGAYGRHLTSVTGQASIMVNAAYPLAQKKRTLQWLIQAGLDAYALFKARQAIGGWVWNADGGHNHGRVWLIVLAGHLLDIPEMKTITKAWPKAQWAANSPHELVMAKYVDQTVVDATNGAGWQPSYAGKRPSQPYSRAMIGMPDMMVPVDPGSQNADWNGHAYRLSLNSAVHWGSALSILAMGLAPAWDRPAFVDFCVRAWHAFNGLEDPWRARLGYGPIGGADTAKSYGGHEKYWQQPWAFGMFGQHHKTFHRFPWQ